MKARTPLLQMRYGSLLSSKGWLTDNPKWRGMLVHPRTTQGKTVSKKTVLWVDENKECLHILICHQVIFQS